MMKIMLRSLAAALFLLLGSLAAPNGAQAQIYCPQNIFGTNGVTPTAGQWWVCLNWLQTSAQTTLPFGNLPNGDIFVGNTRNFPAPVAMSGDGTLSNSGALTVTKTNGVPFGTAATVNTGTSGATIPLNNGNNTSSGNQTHSGTENFTGTIEIGGTPVTLPVPVAIGGTASANVSDADQTLFGAINASACGKAQKPSWCSGTDIGAWLNAAFTYASGLGIYHPKVILDPNTTYAQTTTIVWPLAVDIDGQGAKITRAATSGVALVCAAGSQAYNFGKVSNLSLVGPTYSSGHIDIGLYLGGDPTNTISPSTDYCNNAIFEHVAISGFKYGVTYGNNAFRVTIDQSSIGGGNYDGVYVTTGNSNSGEMMKLTDTSVFNNLNCGLDLNQFDEWAISGGSIDYNVVHQVCGNLVNLRLSQTHIEGNSGVLVYLPNTSTYESFTMTDGSFYDSATTGTHNGYITSLFQFTSVSLKDVQFNSAGVTIPEVVYTNSIADAAAICVYNPLFPSGAIPYSDAALGGCPNGVLSPKLLNVAGGNAFYPLSVNSDVNNTTAYLKSSSTDNNYAVVDTAAASTKSGIILAQNGVNKWFLENSTTNIFDVYDVTHSQFLLQTDSSGNLEVGPSGQFFGIGRDPGFPLDVTAATTTIANFSNSGANNMSIQLNDGAGGHQAVINFADAATVKWQLGKQTDNSFFGFDNANGNNFLAVSTSGNLSLGETGKSVAVQGQTSVTAASATALTVASTGSNNATVTINNQAGSQQSTVNFSDGGTLKWYLGKQSDNSFFAYDPTNSNNFIAVTTGGSLTLGESGKTTTIQDQTIVTAASATPLTVASTGSNNSAIIINDQAGGQQSNVTFQDAGTNKWQIGKSASNAFFAFDNANSANFLAVDTSGNTTIGETGKTLNLVGTVNTASLSVSSPVYTDGSKNLTSTAPAGYSAVLSGTTASLGGGALAAGACTSGTVSITGAATSMVANASPVADPGDAVYWKAWVSSANTVTVKVCVSVAATPTAEAYNVRVLQ